MIGSLIERSLRRVVRPLLNKTGLDLVRYRGDAEQQSRLAVFRGLLTLRDAHRTGIASGEQRFLEWVAKNCHLVSSRSQNFQDLFVLWILEGKRNGFFVEFGATDGLDLSNTYLLEKNFDWQGILSEPNTEFHELLKANRACAIDSLCVWRTTGERLEFQEVANTGLSSLATVSGKDILAHARVGSTRLVETVSLNDLLSKYAAPAEIDFLSVDTEGSELEILKTFNFDVRSINIIIVEHNFTEDRWQIHDLLASHGYIRCFPFLSGVDDWYVLKRTGLAMRCHE